MANKNLNAAKEAKKDEFYTQLPDIENELRHYKEHFRGKVVLCNCDDPYESNFFKYFALNFNNLGLKKLMATCYDGSPIMGQELQLFTFDDEGEDKRIAYKVEITEVTDTNGDGVVNLADVQYLLQNDKNVLTLLKGHGDFRSAECIEMLKEADIVCTNPPFSLFREYVAQLIKYQKKFLILGNINTITTKDMFSLIRDNKMWLGITRHGTGSMWFRVPDNYPVKSGQKIIDGIRYQTIGSSAWFTNMDHKKRHEELILYKTYTREKYPRYDNYDAINVDKSLEIPCDYDGIMGVPITFIDKYNPEQFEIVGNEDSLGIPKGRGYVNGKRMYSRIFIRRK